MVTLLNFEWDCIYGSTVKVSLQSSTKITFICDGPNTMPTVQNTLMAGSNLVKRMIQYAALDGLERIKP